MNNETTTTNDEITYKQRQELVIEMGKLGIVPTLSQTGGRSVASLAKKKVLEEGPAKNVLLAQTEGQQVSTRGATQQELEVMTKGQRPAKGPKQYIADAIEQRRNKANKDFDAAREAPNIKNSDDINAVMDVPEFRKTYIYAYLADQKRPKPKGIPEPPFHWVKRKGKPDKKVYDETGMPEGGWNINALDQVRVSINKQLDIPPGSDKGVTHSVKEALQENNEILKNTMSKKVPNYRKALKNFETTSNEIEAYELGTKVYETATFADDVRDQFNNLKTDKERDVFRLGALTTLHKKFRADPAKAKNWAAQIRSPEMLDKHRVLLPNDEAAERFLRKVELFDEQHLKAKQQTPGSDTAETLLPVVDAVADVVRGGGSLVRRTASRAMQMGKRAIDQKAQTLKNRETGGLLATEGVGQNLNVIEESMGQDRKLSENMINRGLLSGALTQAQVTALGDDPKPTPPFYNRRY